jgi:alkylation response protein AidB-like acyl-CoA dehydrogenase
MEYHAPDADIAFALTHIGGLADLLTLDEFNHLDISAGLDAVREAGRFAERAIAPTNRIGDLEGIQFVDGRVSLPPAMVEAYGRLNGAGWAAIGHPLEHGGGGAPLALTLAVREMLTSGNLALSMAPFLAGGVIATLMRHGRPEQQNRYVPRLVAGEWAATMDITEPQAGSDVGACTTRAEPRDDGSYRVFGQKTFISFGDHDLTDQVVHLVLARLPDGAPGTKGLSLFLVPKRLIAEDGSIGELNDLAVAGVEHKLGLRASPTCTMSYGERGDGAVAELVGAEHDGMRAMFTMMNDARVGVGLQGVAVAELATQWAIGYAKEREQGRALIIEHPDVRRMVLAMRAGVFAMRALVQATARAIDLAAHHPDPVARSAHQGRADLLTPIGKAWCTDLSVRIVSEAIQVYGGLGFIEEAGVAQLYRDVRITPIYEGTNGIQAIDLVQRKVIRDGGRAAKALLAESAATLDRLGATDPMLAKTLHSALSELEAATDWLLSHAGDPPTVLAGATAYLRLFGTVLGATLVAGGIDAAARAEKDGRRALTLLRVYAEHLLPDVYSLARQVTAGAESLYALTADEVS